MQGVSGLLTRWLSAGLVVALLTQTAAVAQGQNTEGQNQDAASTQPSPSSQATAPSSITGTTFAANEPEPSQTSGSQLPDSPSAVQPGNDQTPPTATTPASSKPPQAPSGKAQEPVGTAAAEQEKLIGVAASRPAGTAIAPAKQKRARMLLIKVSAILGAGVAIGTVVALSSGSPSRPPGSH
jgi:hypothetical protein